MNQIFQVSALLVVTLSTNEVKIGTATIGSDTFDVVGLQVVTNRVISLHDESWTNTYAGPFIGTNLVKAPVLWGTNIFIRPLSSNWIYTIPAVIEN
jgi:hypothetical protein